MNLANEFAAWAREPRRTNEELYLAELLIDEGHNVWKRVNKTPWSRPDYNALDAHRKRRLLNPAYRAKLSPEKLAHAVEVWGKMEGVANDRYNDRPVRDLTALRFFPHLTKVELRTELANLSGLNELRALCVLDLRDARLADLSALAEHPQLETVGLFLDWPWPELASLANLPRLKALRFHGNILALADVEVLSAAEDVMLNPNRGGVLPLRSVEQAPAMPLVRALKLYSTASLSGLERYPLLEKLEVDGPFEDLLPLATLQSLRELTLMGERFYDLAPLARLPRLRTLELQREHGLDLTPLSDSPSLREVKSNCEVLKTELVTLNAALGFFDVSEFLATEPKKLGPLRYISFRSDDPEYVAVKRERPKDGREAVFGDDPLLGPAERRWFIGLVREKLKPFGDSRWINISDLQDTIIVKLYRAHEAISVGQMIEAVRPLLALPRFLWEIFFIVETNGDPDEFNWEMPDHSEFDAEREREDWEESKKNDQEHREMLEREHQLSLQQQQGLAIVSDGDSPMETEPEVGDKPAADEKFEADDDDDDEFVDNRSFRVWVSEGNAWLDEDEAVIAVDFLAGVRIEDWHKLPEPPAQRPLKSGLWE